MVVGGGVVTSVTRLDNDPEYGLGYQVGVLSSDGKEYSVLTRNDEAANFESGDGLAWDQRDLFWYPLATPNAQAGLPVVVGGGGVLTVYVDSKIMEPKAALRYQAKIPECYNYRDLHDPLCRACKHKKTCRDEQIEPEELDEPTPPSVKEDSSKKSSSSSSSVGPLDSSELAALYYRAEAAIPNIPSQFSTIRLAYEDLMKTVHFLWLADGRR